MQNENIGKKVYILLSLGIIILTIMGIISNVSVEKASLQNHADTIMHNYSKQFESRIKKETQTIKSFLKLVAEKENIYRAFKHSNKQKLFHETEEIYNNLNHNNGITHFYFIKPNGEVFLRVHDFDKSGDIINRYTFLQAKKSEKLFSGIEFGLKKNYTLRVVYPWRVKGKLVGYIEIGKEIDKILEMLKSELGIDMAIGIDKKEYKDAPNFVQKKLNTFMQTERKYIVYSTFLHNKKIIELFEESKQSNWVEFNNKEYISYVASLEDISKHKLGDTLFLVDITSDYKQLIHSLYFYVLVMVMGTLLMLLLSYFFIRKKQTELNEALANIDVVMREQSGLLSLFEHGNSVLFKWNNDEHWSINYVSSNVKNLLGYDKDDFMSSEIAYAECIHEDDIANVTLEVEKGSKSSDTFFKHTPYRIVTKDKKIKWVLDYTVLLKDKDEKIVYYLGYLIDITEHEHILKNLEKFIDTQDNIVILSDGNEISFANKKFFDFFGYENLEDFKKVSQCVCEYFVHDNRFFHLGKITPEQNWIEEMMKLPEEESIVAISDKDLIGHAFSVHINRFEGRTHIVSFTDISATVMNQIALESKTIHDTLTGAYNREYFDQMYRRMIQEYTQDKLLLGVAFLDIDFFKLVNDSYGHERGDSVLVEFVQRVKEISRDNDMFFRWGGEEFILILKIKRVEDLYKIVDKIRKAIEIKHFNIVGKQTCSIGATIYKDKEAIEKTIKRADDAVYEAKENGRNRVVIRL